MNWLENKLLKLFLTRERLQGFVQHGATALAAWLVTKGIVAEAYTPTILGGCLGIFSILWSANTGGKETTAEIVLGIMRHLLTMLGTLLLSKGLATTDQVNEIIGGALMAISVGFSATAPEKAEATAKRLRKRR